MIWIHLVVCTAQSNSGVVAGVWGTGIKELFARIMSAHKRSVLCFYRQNLLVTRSKLQCLACFILRVVYQLFDLLDAIWRLILQGSFSKSLSRLNGSICFNTLILRGVILLRSERMASLLGKVGWLVIWCLLISWGRSWQVKSWFFNGFRCQTTRKTENWQF